jgi:replicative DNA helicase
MGKSTMLEMVAEHWASKKAHVVLVHLENDFDYTMNRRLCRWSRVPIAAIEDGNLTDNQTNTIRDTYERMDSLETLHYLGGSGSTMTELIAELSIRHSEGVCDAVVVDYLNKVRPSREQAKLFAASPFERQADDAELLKSWAVKHKVPAFTAVQMNKDGQGNGRQTRQNIRGSGQVSEKSQLVVVLTREICEHDEIGVGGQVIAHKGEYSPQMTVRVDKQNRGRTSEWQMFYNGKHFEVRDVSA